MKRIERISMFTAWMAFVFMSVGNVSAHVQAKKIKVSNEFEFLKALGSDRTITVAEGSIINLSNALNQEMLYKEAGLTKTNEYDYSNYSGSPLKAVRKETDGLELCLAGVKNLTIEGEGAVRPQIVVEPRYADVLTFEACSNIVLRNLELGHTPEKGYCSGGVLSIMGSSKIVIDNCDLYGCGMEGITSNDTEGLQCTKSIIRDCSYSIMTLHSCKNFTFSGCDFYRNEEFSLVNVHGSSQNVHFNNCYFTQNNGQLFYLDAPIKMTNCEIHHTSEFGIQDMIDDNNCKWYDDNAPIRETADAVKTDNVIWEGKMDGQNIKLACAIKDGIAIGELFMDNGPTYSVFGFSGNDGLLRFKAFDNRIVSQVIYSFTGEIKGKTFEGFDLASKSAFKLNTYKGKIPFKMNREGNAYCSPYNENFVKYFKSDGNPVGIYNYEDIDGSRGSVDLSRTGPNWETLQYTVDCYNPAGNQALTEGTSPLRGDFIEKVIQRDNCYLRYRILFFDGFLIIKVIDGKQFGCFSSGQNQSIEGIYVALPSVG